MKPVDEMSPREMVGELDKFIIGQKKAKQAVAIALRNRIRRQKLSREMQEEIAPKNIIMIGPTGVGKTEIARRLSKITGAPFLKVEATKYSEVGYMGRDVESMIRDLMSVSINMVKAEMRKQVEEEVNKRTEEALLDVLVPRAENEVEGGESAREYLRKELRNKKLEDRQVEITVQGRQMPSIEVFSGTNFEEMDLNIGGLGGILGGQKKRKKTTVRRAREFLSQEETDKLLDQDRISEAARDRVENTGIVFIDEIDKIVSRRGQTSGPDVSREGVQRDILPIVEGCQVNTRQGVVDTSHILFIAAGAFNMSKPSDLIPELQGRFPIRVEMNDLLEEDFYQILTQPQNALLKQYKELLAVEGVTLDFSDDAIHLVSQMAVEINRKTENIGARRLHSVMELLLEEVSFSGPELDGQSIPITVEYVRQRLAHVVEDQDLSHYIL